MTVHISVRRKAERRSHLKRFSSTLIHMRTHKILSEPEEGKLKNGEKMDDRYYTFALKARSAAAKEVWGGTIWFYDKGVMKSIKVTPEMVLPMSDDGMYLRSERKQVQEPKALHSDGVMRPLLDKRIPVDEGNYIPRAEVLAQLQRMRTEQESTTWRGSVRHHGKDKLEYIVLDRGRYFQIRYYFNRAEHYIIRAHVLENTLKRSIQYGSREALLRALGNNNVYWEQVMKLDEVSSLLKSTE